MNDKKGQSLSINTIIITILAIFVLVILVVALTGGTGNFVEWWNKVFGGSALDVQTVVLTCNGYCQSYESSGSEVFRSKFCEKSFEVDTDMDKKADTTLYCVDLSEVSCPAIQC